MGTKFRAPVAVAATGSLAVLSMLPAAANVGDHHPPSSQAGCGWSVVDGPNPSGDSILYDVHATASGDVWAVGSAGSLLNPQTLSEHWDGTSWQVIPTPNPTQQGGGNVLDAVGATSATDVWAVGSHIRSNRVNRPLMLHYDGNAWSQVPGPSGRFANTELNAVDAISPDDAWVVGSRFRGTPPMEAPMAIHWDGTAWHSVRVPNPPGVREDELLGISSSGPDDVWAVGIADDRSTLILHFDGSRWHRVPSPNPPGDARDQLNDVVSIAADDAWAVGTGGAPAASLAEHWDGTSWQIVSTPNRPRFDELAGVAATPTGSLWAVGLFQPPAGGYQTLAEQYDGTDWSLTNSPSPQNGDQLEGVAATGSDVWAVGVDAADPDGVGKALILHHC